MKKLLALILAMGMLLALSACGGKTPETAPENPGEAGQPAHETAVPAETATPEETAAPEENGQNPAMNVVGNYGTGRANMQVECEGTENAKVTVTWSGSAWENSQWVMSGKIDPETLVVNYDNCVRTNRTFKADGEIDKETVIYENGTGKLVFSVPEGTVTWEDGMENVAEGMVFEACIVPQPDEGDPEHYKSVTAMEKGAVEAVCAGVREAYITGNWSAIAGTVAYPITVSGTELGSAEEFLAFMENVTVDPDDKAAMEGETCRDMFVNGIGICMGDGQIWLADSNAQSEESPRLEIIAINGVTAAKAGDVVLEHWGMKLTVPGEIADQLICRTMDSDVIMEVYEAASVKAAEADGYEDAGFGWLFTLDKIVADKYQDMLCYGEMSGADVFAKDAEGNYYVFYHPTDVRYYREDTDAMKRDEGQWSRLTQWAGASVRQSFISENGLTPETLGSTDLGVFLARLAYMPGIRYELVSLDTGSLAEKTVGFDAAPYLDKLMEGVTYERVEEEAPDGEYIVLNFPEYNMRFDFFPGEDRGKYVRQVINDDSEIVYKATFADGETDAGDVMKAWLEALAAA